ncbi:hypothetical protein GTA08_BOTSDO13054 [Botryosphaeria dothidea]|uniref:PD-(D/E)XK nuclease-like domain-containing protein n=1 Tax=Botryosphaeria dothidea TaxID=55169 RepID=A0A8H4J3U4_9PEZI|nr:hypothetical protein GTA08_BOTSDO13054 [Botryosphaeria dothidea]
MATAAHPSGQWSIISPWETTLIECRRIKNHPSDELEFVFRRGGQEYVFSAYSADFPNFHYATQLGDDNMGSALEQAIFQQAIRELDPVFSRAAQPEHVMRQLKAASQTIDLTLKDGTEGSCEFLENTGRFVEIPYGNPSHLPLYSWDQVQVIEAFTDGFKVQAHPGSMAHAHSHGETFGCILFKDGKLAADGAYREYLQELEKLSEAVFRKEFHDHDPIAGGEHLSNIESWASLRDITLLISRDTYTEGTEHACRMRWLRRLGKGDCALPTLPLVIVQGHEWKLMFAELEDDLKVRLHRHLNLGTTRSRNGFGDDITSRTFEIPSNSFNAGPEFTAIFAVTAIIGVALVAKAVEELKKIGIHLEGIKDELGAQTTAIVQGWQTRGFGAFIYEFLKTEIDDYGGDAWCATVRYLHRSADLALI